MRLAIFATLAFASPLVAQQPAGPPTQPAFADDSAAVVQVVRNLFTGMRTRDTALMRGQFHPTATMRSAANTRTGMVIMQDSVGEWLGSVGSAPAEMFLDERTGPPTIRVDGNIATAWMYYEFWNGDQFANCGADDFVLGRTPTGWKVLFVADSRRRMGCAQNLPKGG
jgi:hypothetical protein